jgi:hypothetical protein
VAGNYIKDTALTSANTVTLSVNVDSIGTWNISIGQLGGMTFAGSGTFTAKGVQTITLTGTGKPAAAGTFTIGITSGASTCSFTITVTDNGTTPGSGGGTGGGGTLADNSWKFTEGGKTYQGTFDDAQLATDNSLGFPITTLSANGSTVTGDTALFYALADVAGGIQANETYGSTIPSPTSPANFLPVFELSTGTTNIYAGGVATTGSTLVIKVTSHNTSTKKMDGTFSGTVKDAAGASKTISAGQFKLTYQ